MLVLTLLINMSVVILLVVSGAAVLAYLFPESKP